MVISGRFTVTGGHAALIVLEVLAFGVRGLVTAIAVARIRITVMELRRLRTHPAEDRALA